MATYLVGNVYRFEADDPEHAVEQYNDAVLTLDNTEVNYIVEE